MRIVGTWAGLRVVLHAEQWQVAVPQAFERLVVQVYVRQLDFRLRQRIGIDGEVVVVGGDLDFAGIQLLDRMVAAVMPEFEFESFAAERDARQLMSETDAEDGLAAHEAADVIDRVRARFGIARTVRKKDAVRLERKNVFGGSLRRDHRDFTAFAA